MLSKLWGSLHIKQFSFYQPIFVVKNSHILLQQHMQWIASLIFNPLDKRDSAVFRIFSVSKIWVFAISFHLIIDSLRIKNGFWLFSYSSIYDHTRECTPLYIILWTASFACVSSCIFNYVCTSKSLLKQQLSKYNFIIIPSVIMQYTINISNLSYFYYISTSKKSIQIKSKFAIHVRSPNHMLNLCKITYDVKSARYESPPPKNYASGIKLQKGHIARISFAICPFYLWWLR